MEFKSLGLAVLLGAFAASALAQTHISGTIKCGVSKGDIHNTIEVGDHPGHVLMIGKGSCTYTTPLEIAGVKANPTYTGAGATELNGAKFQGHGYDVITMENGDKVYVHTQDAGTATEDGKAITYEGTWSFTGGTGKLKGLKGKGTYKGSGDPEGETNSQFEGAYTLPGASTTTNGN